MTLQTCPFKRKTGYLVLDTHHACSEMNDKTKLLAFWRDKQLSKNNSFCRVFILCPNKLGSSGACDRVDVREGRGTASVHVRAHLYEQVRPHDACANSVVWGFAHLWYLPSDRFPAPDVRGAKRSSASPESWEETWWWVTQVVPSTCPKTTSKWRVMRIKGALKEPCG